MSKKIISVILVLVLLVSVTIPAVSALTSNADGQSGEDKDYTITRISHPDNKPRETDGLVPEGDRETSYAWCMEERGDYVYIGTNKNVLGSAIAGFAQALVYQGISPEVVQDLADVITNGEAPQITTTEGGYILRCDKNTGEIVKLYTAPNNVAFRMAIRHGDNIYFGSYASDGVSCNDILRIDPNDNIETVFQSTNGTSMRAACIMDDQLYFGGVDSSIVLDEGDEACAKMAILCKDNNDDSVWNRVADYKDFGKVYTTNPGVQGNISSPIWDICSYQGYIYATIPNTFGFVMFKGHPAADGETANEYGWYWEEVIGYNNGVNNIGLFDDPEGNKGIDVGMLSTTGTPFVFNDELYIMDFDNTIYSELLAIQGILTQLATNTGKPSEYLAYMYNTMRHQQSVWKMDNKTGKFIKSEGFAKAANNPCTEYLWRTAVYDNELYLTTMDSATIYNYITRFTNGSFFTMTPEERSDMLNYIQKLIDDVKKSTDDEKVEDGAEQLGAIADDMVGDLENMELNADNAEDYLDDYSGIKEKLFELVGELQDKLDEAKDGDTAAQIKAYFDTIAGKIFTLYNGIDWKGIQMYAWISAEVGKDTWGFEMYKTADGENYVPVTVDGFGDKYNYGGRTLIPTDKGLYIGTSNPFYGAQLWLLTNKKDEPTEPTDDPTPTVEPTTEPGGEVIYGDVNGDGIVDILDSIMIQKYTSGKMEFTPEQIAAADYNRDGNVDILDASAIQRDSASS